MAGQLSAGQTSAGREQDVSNMKSYALNKMADGTSAARAAQAGGRQLTTRGQAVAAYAALM